MLNLTGTLLILAALLTSGPPDRVDWHASVGLHLAWGPGGIGSSLIVGIDLTPIRFRKAPSFYGWTSKTCGLTDGWNVWVAPHPPCVRTLEHELKHVRQRQAVGTFLWALTSLGPDQGLWQADPPWTADRMPLPRSLNFPLFQLAIPLTWDAW